GLITLMVLTFGMNSRIVWPRTIAAGAIGVVIGKSLMLAGSRGAIAALGGGLVAFVLQTGNARLLRRQIIVALVAVAGWTVVIYRSDSMRKRYEKALSTGSMSGREQLFPEAWRMFGEKPFLGWGPIDNQYELGLRTAVFAIGRHRSDGLAASPSQDTQNL